MERLRIDLPERMDFQTELEVRIGDVNYGGHLGNDALLGLLQEARLRFLGHAGFSEKDVGGCGLIQVDAVIQYLSQAYHGNRLVIEVGIRDFDRIGFELHYRVRSPEDREIARARTGLIFYDYTRQKPCRMPAVFRERLLQNSTPLSTEKE